jgi:hypothetical protein
VSGAAAPRSRPGSYSFRSGTALRRRLVAGGLVLLSIVLMTIYFRESEGGVLHSVQSGGSTVLHPFQVAATRIARPFRDAYSYTTSLVHAKSQNKKLRAELDRTRQQVVQNDVAVRENAELRAQLRYVSGPTFPKDYRYVAADVTGRPDQDFSQQLDVAAGTSSGIRRNDPVVTPDGLVGVVTRVARHAALVTLLTDDVFVSMPPMPLEYSGLDVVVRFCANILQPGRRFDLVPTRANAQPAFGTYLRGPNGTRHGTGLFVLTLAGDRISAMTRFENSVFPWFGLPRSLPST